jgi:type IV secretory pathway protease TraF
MRHRLFSTIVLLAIILLTIVAPPRRHEVDGLSMAPALRPGDVVSSGWLPQAGRLIPPRRYERWLLTAPDGTPIIKRIVGLPGETVRIVAGDLTIDAKAVLTPPRILGEMASAVAPCDSSPGVWQRSFTHKRVYDDADFAPEESRRLLPVRDVGLAAVIDAAQDAPLIAAIRVGGRAVRWPLPAGRYALVAGRLDGRLVATAWNLAGSPATAGRSPLPPAPPEAWQIAQPWSETERDDEPLPPLALSLMTDTGPLAAAAANRCIERCLVWRDILHRPPPDGMVSWRLGPDEVFVLGDFPAGSHDSRHWGPLPAAAVHHRVDRLQQIER